MTYFFFELVYKNPNKLFYSQSLINYKKKALLYVSYPFCLWIFFIYFIILNTMTFLGLTIKTICKFHLSSINCSLKLNILQLSYYFWSLGNLFFSYRCIVIIICYTIIIGLKVINKCLMSSNWGLSIHCFRFSKI